MAPYTVLYVDDEPDLLVLGKTFLETIGDYVIDTRESAPDGLDALRARPYDAVISDFLMPGMNGLVFLKMVREEFGDTPFILFTGRGREDVVIEAINFGVDFYLQKGGDVKAQFAELAHKVKMAVERKRAVDERTESEKRLSAIFHASPIHQMISEFSTTRILDINDRFLSDLRLPRTEVIGRTIAEIGLYFDPDQYSAIMQQLVREGFVRNAELRVRAQSGRTYTTLTSMTRVQTHGQDLIYTQSMDITAQKKAQQTINALLNAPPDVSMLLDTRGIILAANEASTARYGHPVQGLIGMDAFRLISPDYADLRKKKVGETIATKKPLVYLDDRTGRTYENHLYPVIGPEGVVAAIAVHSHDVSEERAAKEALRESEAKYRLVVEHSHDTIYIYRGNNLIFINRQAEDLTGFTHEELMGRDIWDFIHPDDRERLKEAAKKRFAGGHLSSAFEAQILRKNGEVLEGEFFVDLIDFLGKPAILGIARDITEKKRAEDVIRDREEQIRSLSDNLPNGLVYQIVIEPDGKRRFTYVSAGIEQIHEVTAEEMLQDPAVLYSQIPAEDQPRMLEAENRARDTMSLFNCETRIRTPSGIEKWVLIRSAPRILPNGGIIWDGIELDITAAKRAEEELRAAYEQLTASQEELQGQFESLKDGQELLAESEEKYRTLAENMDDGVFIAQGGNLVFVNEALAHVIGYEVNEILGKSFAHLIAPEDREMVVSRHVQRLSGSTLSDNYEFSLIHKDGTTRFRVRMRVGTGRYHGSLAVIGTLHDITEERQREEALRESEELYRSLVTASPDGIAMLDNRGILTYASPRALEMFHIGDLAEAIGTSVFTWISESDHALARERFQEIQTKDKLVNNTYRLVRKDGSTFDVEMHSARLCDRKGTITGTISILRDITERLRAETALRESEDRYRRLIHRTFDAVVVYQAGMIVLANDTAGRIAGYHSGDEILGKPILSFIHPDYHQKVIARQKQMLESSDGVVPLIPEKFLRADGSIVDVEVMASTTQYEGKPAIQVVFRDITERQHSEQALRESEENYRRIIEDMQDVFYRTDKEGTITMISTYGARLVGFNSADEIIGKYHAADFYVDAKERDALISVLMRDHAITGYPITLRDRAGNLHEATASSRLIFDKEGNMAGIEGILHDVTQIREVEKALRQANLQITLLNSITRHDIRNQLLALNGWLELSRASIDDPDRMLDLITREQKIADVIRQQIDFTTLFEDMGVKPPSWQDPAVLARRSSTSLPFNNVQLDINLPRIEVFADPLFEKVFYNLFDNALRYGGDRLTQIRVYSHGNGEDLNLIIEDNGGGIPDREKERLFERGYGRNTGLGLFLAREILAITGLTIRETGTPEKGARFEIRIPSGKFRINSR